MKPLPAALRLTNRAAPASAAGGGEPRGGLELLEAGSVGRRAAGGGTGAARLLTTTKPQMIDGKAPPSSQAPILRDCRSNSRRGARDFRGRVASLRHALNQREVGKGMGRTYVVSDVIPK